MNASMRKSQQSRQSSAMTSKTNVRESAGSGIAISASGQGGNSNIPQTTKAPGQTTSSATGVRRVSGLQAASLSTLGSCSTVSNLGTTLSVHASSIYINSLSEALDVKLNEFFNKYASMPAGDADLLKNLHEKLASLES